MRVPRGRVRRDGFAERVDLVGDLLPVGVDEAHGDVGLRLRGVEVDGLARVDERGVVLVLEALGLGEAGGEGRVVGEAREREAGGALGLGVLVAQRVGVDLPLVGHAPVGRGLDGACP